MFAQQLTILDEFPGRFVNGERDEESIFIFLSWDYVYWDFGLMMINFIFSNGRSCISGRAAILIFVIIILDVTFLIAKGYCLLSRFKLSAWILS